MSMPEQQKIRIAEHIEVLWTKGVADPAGCPNCGAAGLAARLLEIDYRPPDKHYRFNVNVCSACEARFFDNAHSMDYGTEELIEIGWHVYQIQIGAGLWPIAAPLARIGKPPGARMLEIGGAYGFGLDFGIRARYWAGEGFDPSPLAGFGKRELGLNLKQDYFEEKDLWRGPYDVVLSTEVIEHLPAPQVFLNLMFRALREDGILLLTTPDGGKIGPELEAAQLLPMLSPGAHLVLQSKASLELALRRAGFAHVKIEQNGLSLIAFASASAFELRDNPSEMRMIYRHYLVERGRLGPLGPDLLLGFAGRALFEAVNDADFAAAEAAWDILAPAVRQRFGIDLERIDRLPEAAKAASLAELVHLMPLGLGMILYSRGLLRLSQSVPRAGLTGLFRLALEAVNALQDALAKRSLTDGLALSLRAAIETEIALCLAQSGDPNCVAAVTVLLRRDAVHAVTAWRVFIALVNAARFDLARALQREAALDAPPDDMAQDLRLDGLFTMGILALQGQTGSLRAARVFAELRGLLLQDADARGAPGHLFWPALRGEVIALHRLDDHDKAAALLREYVSAFAGAPEDLKQQLPEPDLLPAT